MRASAERNRPYSRAEQIARVRHLISRLHEPKFKGTGKNRVQLPMSSAVAGRISKFEELLANLEGNREPVEVRVTAVMTLAAQMVFSNLSESRMTQLMERARERKRLAAVAEASQ